MNNQGHNLAEKLTKAIPSWHELLKEIISNHPLRESVIHGENHWKSVALTAHYLLTNSDVKADPLVVLLFSVFHDSKRDNDGFDCCHGKHGGRYARRLHGKLHFISAEQMDLLQRACHEHTNGTVTNNPTIGICWDADRLNLFRININPSAEYLNTEIAKKEGTLDKVKLLEEKASETSWDEIYEMYSNIPIE